MLTNSSTGPGLKRSGSIVDSGLGATSATVKEAVSGLSSDFLMLADKLVFGMKAR
jgi:hypothetical protein